MTLWNEKGAAVDPNPSTSLDKAVGSEDAAALRAPEALGAALRVG